MIFRILLVSCLIVFLLVSNISANESTIIPKIDFVDAVPVDIVKALAKRGNYNVVIGSNVSSNNSKRITVHMKDIECLDAIKKILRIGGLKCVHESSALLISTLSGDTVNSAFANNEKVFRLKHIFGKDAAETLSKILTKAGFIAGLQSQELIVIGNAEEIMRVESIINEIDRPVSQILIESKIIEVSESGISELGLKWGREVGKFNFAMDKQTGDFGLTEDILITLSKLAGEGHAEILAEPKILAIDGKESSINIGSRIPYAVPSGSNSESIQWTVSYIDAGVSLKILPKISSDGYITMFLEPEVSSISEWRVTSAGEFPVITTRNAKSEVRIRNGETIIIGGLINKLDRENITKIAILGDIPILGMLFQNKIIEQTKTEVIFLVTPKII